MNDTIRRFGPPNIYDQYPWGTICITHNGSIYKQISRDESKPVWERITDDPVGELENIC